VLVIADCCWGICMLVRGYLNGDRVPGHRARSEPLAIEPFVDYCRVRLADDVGRWGNRRAVLTQHCGNRLDTPSPTR
jgi:hypothetical protein